MILQLKLFRLNYLFESDKQMAQTIIIEFFFFIKYIKSKQQITDDYLLTKATYYSVILLNRTLMIPHYVL